MKNRTAESGFLNIAFTDGDDSPNTAGSLVEITDDLTVKAPTAAGSLKIVGEVVVPASAAGEKCTVATRFSKLRTLTSGAAVSVGAITGGDGAGKVINFDHTTHKAPADLGLAITAAEEADQDVVCLIW